GGSNKQPCGKKTCQRRPVAAESTAMTPTPIKFRFVSAGLLALALFLAPLGAARAAEKPACVYLTIGINKVEGQTRLRHAADDAVAIADWCQSQEGRLFAHVEGDTLTNEQASLKNIGLALQRLQKRAAPGGYVIVSISSHGTRFRGEDYFAVPDGRLVSWGALREALAPLPGTKLLLIDTCRDNLQGQKGAGGISGIADLPADQRTRPDGLLILAACRPGEMSAENDKTGHGFFTKAVLEALDRQADTDHDRLLT